MQTRMILWARSGGMCSLPGCPVVLHRDSRYLTKGTFGELAHNVAASANGPRGDMVRSPILVNEPDNLIMVCPTCHAQIDAGGAENYPEALLRSWKELHEGAVEMLAGLRRNRRARMLICTGSIRSRPVSISDSSAIQATVKAGYMPVAKPFSISLPSRDHALDGTPTWWNTQARTLQHQVDAAQRESAGSESCLAVFGVAEMPSLVLLGYLLGDERHLMPFQYDRVSGACDYADLDGPAAEFTIHYPETIAADGVALVISATAAIETRRIVDSTSGKALSIAEVRATNPSRDLVRSPATVEAFRMAVMQCLDKLEHMAGHKAPIHIFPAMPAPLAVALGAAVQLKAPPTLLIYDSAEADGVFRHALTLPLGRESERPL